MAKVLWPGSKIDVNLRYRGAKTQDDILQHVRLLQAALFYPELVQIDKMRMPHLLKIVIRCRYGPGSRLLNLVKAMAESEVQLEYFDVEWKSMKFCTSDVWTQASRNEPFGKPLIVQPCPDGRIRMSLKGGILGTESLRLSNCPCSVSRLEKMKSCEVE